LHVGLVIYGSLDSLSGGYLYDRKLVEHLRAQGDTVEIISLPWRNYAARLSDNFNPTLRKRLANFRGDVLIQDELNHPSLFLLNQSLISNLQFPIISIVHHLRISEQHPALLRPLYRAVETRYLRLVDGFIFNSETTRGVVAGLRGGAYPFVVAQPAGDRLPIQIARETIRERAGLPGPLRILFLGNVIPRKGLHTLLAALSRLEAGSWRLTVAGDLRIATKYVAAQMAAVARAGWQAQVEFTGPVRDARLIEIMAACHVLAMPSQYEGFGIACLEGMGLGLPAIASTAGAAHEIITEGETGFLVEPGDAATLAAHLRALHTNRVRLAHMGQAARARFLAQPGWEESMGRIRTFLADSRTHPHHSVF
jgi:glycosyltransferase involved in cell wall biosynthesis